MDEYLIHYGVLGMKWGKRKAASPTSGMSRHDKKLYRADRRIEKAQNRINKLSKKKHGTARYEDMKMLRQNIDINKAYKNKINARQAYKNAKGTSKEKAAKTDYKKAKKAYNMESDKIYRTQSNTAFVSQLGIGKSARGSYYRSREMGRGKVNSALRAYGKQSAINLGAGVAGAAAITAGKAVMEEYMKRQSSNVIKAKHVKVRTVR